MLPASHCRRATHLYLVLIPNGSSLGGARVEAGLTVPTGALGSILALVIGTCLRLHALKTGWSICSGACTEHLLGLVSRSKRESFALSVVLGKLTSDADPHEEKSGQHAPGKSDAILA